MKKILTVFILFWLTFLVTSAYSIDWENIKFSQEEKQWIEELYKILKDKFEDDFEIIK